MKGKYVPLGYATRFVYFRIFPYSGDIYTLLCTLQHSVSLLTTRYNACSANTYTKRVISKKLKCTRLLQNVSRQCTYNVILTRVHESLLPRKSNKYYIFVCVRVCSSVPRRVHVALLIQHVTRMRHIVTSFVPPMAPPYFSTLSHKRRD